MTNNIIQKTKNLFNAWNLLSYSIIALAALFYLYNYILRIVPSVMLSDLIQSYHISSSAILGSFSATYYYIYTPMQMPVGFLVDRFGAGRILTLASSCCAIGMALFANSNSFLLAEFGRFLIGFGSAFGFVGILKLATIWLPQKSFGLVTGMVVSVGMLGGLFGDITLAELVKIEGWRATSFITAAFGALLTLALFLTFRAQMAKNKNIISKKNPNLNKILVSFLITFREPQIWLNGIVGCLLYLPICAFAELWGIPYFKEAYQFTNLHAAEAVSLIFAGWIVGGPLIGWLSDKTNQRRYFLTGGASLTTIALAIVLYVPSPSLLLISIALFAIGFCASSQILIFALSNAIVSSRYAGTAIAFVNLLVMLGGALFQPIIGKILDLHSQREAISNTYLLAQHAFQSALFILPLATLIAVYLTFFIKEAVSSK